MDGGIPLATLLWVWAEAFVRWLHVIAGIAWIGSSFYFVATDLSLQRRDGLPDRAHGETWQVHGGGFYHIVKYLVAPTRLPDQLTWFKWEAYTTFLSGFALMVMVYYAMAELYLIESAVMDLAPWQASAISFGALLLGWLVYDLLCKSPLGRNDVLLMALGFGFLVLAAWGFTQIFSPRGAFLQIGALIGTIMVANVAHIIIPGQRKVVAALKAGQTPDPEFGRRGKQRSVHNNYLTLPVVFVMIGGHYPLAYATAYPWAIFALLLVMGVLMRHFFNSRHAGRGSPWWTWAATAACGLAIAALSAAGPAWREGERTAAAAPAPTDPAALALAAEEIVLGHCAYCHAAEPGWPGLATAPKGVALETPAEIRAHALAIGLQAGWSRAMPPGNLSGLTAEERAVLAAFATSAR